MIKIENTEVVGWEAAIRGMRNPMNSWDRSDSEWGCEEVPGSYRLCRECPPERWVTCHDKPNYVLGPNDHALMMSLRDAGTDHRKYLRMITVYTDITAPLYWWKEFDTYKVGTVANSCSTMHKIAAKEFTIEDFSHEHLDCNNRVFLYSLIDLLNEAREEYNLESGKTVSPWWQMIQLLPSSYNQKRTIMLNYEVLASMYKARKNHKLDEWRMLCEWIEGLPYSELITGVNMAKKVHELGKELVRGFQDGVEAESKKNENDDNPCRHLIDITPKTDIPELMVYRLYGIASGFTEADLTPFEMDVLKTSSNVMLMLMRSPLAPKISETLRDTFCAYIAFRAVDGLINTKDQKPTEDCPATTFDDVWPEFEKEDENK